MHNKPIVNRIRSVEELERLLAKAEVAIDAQASVIKLLQSQLENLDADVGSDQDHDMQEADGGSADESPSDADMRSPATKMETTLRSVTSQSATSPSGNSATSPPPVPSISQMMELKSLRDEVAELRLAHLSDQEELASRSEEIKSLSLLLANKEAAYEQLKSGHADHIAAATEAGKASLNTTLLGQLRSFHCNVCDSQPFRGISDVPGVTLIHEQACFEAQQMDETIARLQDRVAILQEEMLNLKSVVASTAQPSPAPAEMPPPPPPGISAQPHHHHTHHAPITTAGTPSQPGTPSASPAPASGAAAPAPAGGDVVEVAVVRDLQSKLTSLIHVHRQLLRKYAVNDVECADMADALQARDNRIGELTEAALRHAAQMTAAQQAAEQQIATLQKEHQAQMAALRQQLGRPMVSLNLTSACYLFIVIVQSRNYTLTRDNISPGKHGESGQADDNVRRPLFVCG
jgi:hypothetical protein